MSGTIKVAEHNLEFSYQIIPLHTWLRDLTGLDFSGSRSCFPGFRDEDFSVRLNSENPENRNIPSIGIGDKKYRKIPDVNFHHGASGFSSLEFSH